MGKEERREELDPNDLLAMTMTGIQTGLHQFFDDMVVKGPYPQGSPLLTLVEVPVNLPCLESPEPIPTPPPPPIHGQYTVHSAGCPNLHYHSPFYHQLCSISYHPYTTLIPAE